MYFKQAKDGKNEWWMYLITIFLMGLGYFVGQLPLYFTQMNAIDNNPTIGTAELEEFNSRMDFSILGIDSNLGLFLLFTSEIVSYLIQPEVYALNVQWGKLFWLFIICIFILPIQTTLEELVFRSYLMKGIGLMASHKWIPLVITSILFGLVHGTNPEVAKYGIVPMQLYYIGAGLLLGIMTIMDDGLELAIGVHAATNIFGALFMSYEGSVLQTDSIWRMSEVNAWLMAVLFLVAGIIFLLLSKKMFDWGPWNKIWEKIDLN